MMANKHVSVVEDIATLTDLGFVEDGFHCWNAVIIDSSINKTQVTISGDYVFLKCENPSRKGKMPFDSDIVTLWNRDIAGPIPREKLENFINLLEEGNSRSRV